MSQPIVLGSSSKWRAEVLRGAGISFTAIAPNIDEKALRIDNPYAMTFGIAMAKARALRSKVPAGSLLVTSDQVCTYRGVIREKPRDVDEARRWLRDYRGDQVHVVTSVVAVNVEAGRIEHGHDTATVSFERFPPSVIEQLISKGDVLSASGGFVHEDPLMAPYVRCFRQLDENDTASEKEAVEKGSDPDVLTSVSGLPLKLTLRLLQSVGWEG